MTEKSMESRIRRPFLILILTVPLITLVLFNIGIRIYAAQNAKNELLAVSKTMETLVKKELAGNLDSVPAGKLDHAFEKLYRAMNASKLASNTQMLLYNSHQAFLYPKDPKGFLTQQVIEEVTRQLPGLKEKKVCTLTAGGERYYAVAYRLPDSGGKQPAIVFLSQTGETNSLINRMNLILFAIMAVGAALASVIASRISLHVSQPVQELTILTEKIGGGDFSLPVSGHPSNICEINRLYQGVAEMEERLSAYDQTQKTFLQNASHELRTPLMSIQGYAEGIEKGIVPDAIRAAEIISSESKRLNSLVEELLTLSRIENRTFGRDFSVLILADVLKEYVQRLGGYAVKLGRQLSLSLSGEAVRVLADDDLLSQAVMNVASNCLRYADAKVDIVLAEDGKNAVIRISDDGKGISEQDLPHVFERFFKGKGGNFGLGLSIAKSAVEFMGGSIAAYNGDHGAVFELRLPKHTEVGSFGKSGK